MQTKDELESEVETIKNRMFRRRLSPDLRELNSWQRTSIRNIPQRKYKEYIKNLLEKNYLVTSGYLSTAIRGHHDYWIFHKERKLKK